MIPRTGSLNMHTHVIGEEAARTDFRDSLSARKFRKGAVRYQRILAGRRLTRNQSLLVARSAVRISTLRSYEPPELLGFAGLDTFGVVEG
jgi:hypothetical protein